MEERKIRDVNMYIFKYTNYMGKRVRTRYRLTVEEAAERFAGLDPQPDLGTLEVRTVGWSVHDNTITTAHFMPPKKD